MAHFAELDENNIVTRVVVVSNDIETAAGPLGENNMHVDGETWCKDFFGSETIWKQTSYNHNFRKKYAGAGMIYDESKNKFLMSQPHASWALNDSDDWQAPVTWPNGDQSEYIIDWDEDNLRWVGTKDSENPNYRWDANNTQWVSI